MKERKGIEKRESKRSILEQLKTYSASDYYPFHMPGHKRNRVEGEGLAEKFPNPFSIDITEISGFDDLHHPEGMLLESMKQAAAIYGADESCYLVNGSSGGILAAVSGCVKRGGKILIGRNCHKSVYNGVFLNCLWAEYVYPQFIEELGINGGILPEDVETALSRCPDIQAVLIVSPTYDGIVSDISRIAETVHKKGIPLIVDEAHGAHFPFGREWGFPASALDMGADVVIQSLHKTLPSFTQTAVLHMKKKFLGQEKMERIKQFLTIYQSSSPSYLFLAAAEQCILYMNGPGRSRLGWLFKEMEKFRQKTAHLSLLRVPGREWVGKKGVYDMDLSKILIYTGNTGKSGAWLGEKLRREYHLELEMCAPQYGLALTSLWDREEGLERLYQAVTEIDSELASEASVPGRADNPLYDRGSIYDDMTFHMKAAYSIFQAQEMPAEEVLLSACSGRAAAEYVYLYPPGIPCLVPGEVITDEMVQKILRYEKMGFSVHGLKNNGNYRLKVLCIKGKNEREL